MYHKNRSQALRDFAKRDEVVVATKLHHTEGAEKPYVWSTGDQKI